MRNLKQFIPESLDYQSLVQADYPRIAKNSAMCHEIEAAVQRIATYQRLVVGDCRSELANLADESVHLVLTSPPYWNLKKYPETEGQLGHIEGYDDFLLEMAALWQQCYRVLAPGGRLVMVVGDVSVKRRTFGRHLTFPLHASSIEICRRIGFDNLTPIIWSKHANATYEVKGGGGFLGKPYEPNAVIKNDIEFILLQRKSGENGGREYRAPSPEQRLLSLIPERKHHQWFQPIWSDIPGESLRDHPAPFPLELASRLVRMFSFVGDTVLDPFSGTGTTLLAAGMWGRNGIGFEIERHYVEMSKFRLLTSLAHASLSELPHEPEVDLPHASMTSDSLAD